MAKRDLEVREPDLESGSLNHTHFDFPGVWWSVRKSANMLPQGKRSALYVAAAFQVSLGLLDLLGIALIGLVAAIAVSGIATASLPGWAQGVLDSLGLGAVTVSQLSVIIALVAVAVLVAKTVVSALMTRVITRFLAHRQADLSVGLAREFLQRPLAQVQRWTTSEATYALGQGASAATVALLGSSIIIASEAFLFFIIGVSLLIYDPVLTLVVGVLLALLVLFLQRYLGQLSARNAERMKDASIDTLRLVAEAMTTYRETTVLNRRDLYVAQYERVVNKYATANANSAFIVEVPKYALEVALYVGALVLGVVQFITKDWTAAATTTALFLAAGTRVIPSMLRLQGAGITIRNSAVMAQPTFFMFDQLDRPRDPREPARPKRLTQRIHEQVDSRFEGFEADVVASDLRLTFSDAVTPVIDGVSFRLPAGGSIAFVGATGAGKSTLADLVLGVLDPDGGLIEIGGLAPREAISRWTGAITYVPQNVALIDGSVKENVALGLPADLIREDLVWEALNRAHLGDFLEEYREGLETNVGERGFRLSGGQRQRLGIARALYTRPKLLVLDEATSALDGETERAITQTLQELEGTVTTITIAHRLVTVQSADQILALEHGRVVGHGTFDEVRRQSPQFDKQASLLGL